MIKNTKLTISEIVDLLETGKITSLELCKSYLKRVEETDSKIKAFLYIDENDILKQAEASDLRREKGKTLGKYDGVPISLKDVISVEGQPCRCGSKILEPYNAIYDATSVEKLKGQGIVLFGRNNMDEFAMGSSCENSAYFPTSNPWDLERVPGGSSGGSAASVAAGQVPASFGSDTGGSVRQPAAFCGVVGLKPTYGRISRYGLVAYASSFDQIGPIAGNVSDTAALLDIVSGNDPKDSTSLPDSDVNFLDVVENAGNSLKGTKIGLPKEYFEMEGLDSEIKCSIDKTLKKLKSLGAELVDVSIPHTKYAIAAYYVIATAEASANLARFDTVRYGKRADEYNDLMENVPEIPR